MEEDTEYKKLAVDERCVHKNWKARVDGYEEAAKLFREIDDEKSPEWNKFLGLIKKFVIDSHAMAQEKGLEATLIYVENCGNAGKTVGEVISGIVTKCIAAPKTKTKDLSVQIALMYIEIEKHEAVLEELLKGAEHKNPKIMSACISTITLALKNFGTKVVAVKPIIKKIPALLSDRDKTVRDESKILTVEIFRWIGVALKPQLASLPPVLVTELETEFDKVKNDKPTPIRYLRSQQERQAAMPAQAAQNADVEDGDDADGDHEEIDPMDLIDPVDILSKLPKDFFEKIEAKKWQERKECLEALDVLLQNPKLESGDYGDVVRALKKVLSKDANVVLVAMSGKSLASLAKGLGKRFQPYASACVPAVLEKFKEKKPNVVTALRDAIDAIYPSTNLEVIQEDILEALNSKNPAVKTETASFLARAFTKTQPSVLNKKLLKLYITALLKTLNESDPGVRDASADAIGTAKKLVGDKIISPLLTDVDALKMVKINECFEKAVIVVKIVGVKKDRPATAPINKNAQSGTPKGGSIEPKAVTRPATGGIKKPGIKKIVSSSGIQNSGNTGLVKSASSAKALPTERDLSPEEVDEKAEEILPPDVLTALCDANWKTRVAAMETFMETVNELDSNCGHSQVLLRVIAKKPGLKDTNFQVIKLKLDAVKTIVDKMGATVTATDYIITDVTEKLGDSKNLASASQALTSIAEAIKLEYVISKSIDFAFEQKSPKVQLETLVWVSNAIKEFGFLVNPKVLIEDTKKGLQHSNVGVRTAAITLIGTMYLYMGNPLNLFFENEKAQLRTLIQAEFEKNAGQKPPTPIRGVKANSVGSAGDDGDDDGGGGEPATINIADLLPRSDISNQITEALLTEISDKEWKNRNEGLTKLQGILNEAKLIKPNLGDLPLTLAARLGDSNAKIAQTSIIVCEQLATTMGPPFKQHVRTFLPGVLNSLGDNKVFIRQAALSCINTWAEQCGYKEFFEAEMIADALKTGGPALRIELWGWLAEKLPAIPPKTIQKEELHACIPHLYSNICDRNAEVRKNANEAVLGVMIHLGFEAMVKALDKQKPTSKKDIQASLDKARPNLPIKPLPKNKQQAPIQVEERPVKGGSAKPRPVSTKGNATANGSQASRTKKGEEEVDTSPLLAINNIKSQRLIDEQKLRVLKWTFTTPREEFIELLRDQMTTANVNKGLMANMFHDDFRYHLKVIDSLNEDLPTNEKALICNLDLILKWVSLRFYDTNPSVLIKGLDYLERVFVKLRANNYAVTENEGSSFIPHLLLKLGDPKDAVRNGVRSILREICAIYPVFKVFAFLMECLKSKNARQRTECLDELGFLIATYTLQCCLPTSQAPLKEIARHISDRDNSVRNAALNCIVQAYFLVGDKIYKLIGQLTEKDLSMLDERIKRAKRPEKKAETPPKHNTSKSPQQDISIVEEQEIEDELPSEEISPIVSRPFSAASQTSQAEPQPTPQKPAGPFKLDPDYIYEIEKGWIKSDQHQMKPMIESNIDFLHTEFKIISRNGVTYPQEKFDKLLNKNIHLSPGAHRNITYAVSPPQPVNDALSTVRATVNNINMPNLAETKMDPYLMKMVKNIGSTDTYVSRASINELNDILESVEKQAVLRDYEELYIESVIQQFKYLSNQPIQASLIMYQPLLASILTFFNAKNLGKNLGVQSVINIMSVLLGLMADHKLSHGDDGQYTKVINAICLKILDRTNFTNLNCALIRLLKETCSSTGLPKFTDLLMKCIWRNVKVMSERSNELNYADVLYEVHEFMSALPSAWWQQRPSDTPLRTVKTIIHNMAKIKGNAILQDLNKIPNHSELHTYLLRVLKNVQKEKDANLSSPMRANMLKQKEQSARMTKAHETMSHIFKLISDKETNKDGLSQLYQFKYEEMIEIRYDRILYYLREEIFRKFQLDNPDVDFEPFLKGASPEFQKFIEDSLAALQKQHINDGNKITSSGTKDADYYMERLTALRGKGILAGSGAQKDHLMDNKVADENLNLNQLANKTSFIKENLPGLSENRREVLQQKLAQFKQLQK